MQCVLPLGTADVSSFSTVLTGNSQTDQRKDTVEIHALWLLKSHM